MRRACRGRLVAAPRGWAAQELAGASGVPPAPVCPTGHSRLVYATVQVVYSVCTVYTTVVVELDSSLSSLP